MSILVEELKKEHSVISEALNEAKNIGITLKEGQKALLSAKNGLVAHLKKEDERLYPALRKEAEKDESLKRTLNTFAKDMESISKAALDFFEKYSGGGSGIDFASDYGRLMSALNSRIRREESIIYAKFDEIEE